MSAVNLRDWIGRKEERLDVADLRSTHQLHAALGRKDAAPKLGDEVPPAWHWMWFTATDDRDALGRDGLTGEAGFLPPVPLPRRMWAGSRLRVHAPLKVGQEIRKRAEIVDIAERQGKTGKLIFVSQRYSIFAGDRLAIEEDFDSVFREDAAPGAPVQQPPAAPQGAVWSRTIDPDPVLLFRYSAVTFNGHRIHYDQPYATQVEGYPGLVVHGPLTATLLMELARDANPGRRIVTYSFRAVSPLFLPGGFTVNGKPDDVGKGIQMWAENANGCLAMQANVSFA
jgi:3-methylfumaryl-CoA hydratase